jgi:hypothetical protein
LCLESVSKFPITTEKSGYFVEFANSIGDILPFKILKNDLTTVMHRSGVRSAGDPNHRNKQITLSQIYKIKSAN